jgi:hypothetical protein
LNSLFESIHQSYEFRINKALTNQTSYLRFLNAQLFSRIAFVTDEIRFRQNDALNAIARRGREIDDPEAECILEAISEVENAVEYAGYSMNGVIGETVFYVDQIEADYFYPLINVLKLESSTIQWTVMSDLRRYNPVTQTAQLITRLEGDYEVLKILYDTAIRNIEREMVAMDEHMNTVKSSMFPQLNGVRDYFNFTVNIIRESLPQCTA